MTLAEALRAGRARLKAAGVARPELDARLLLLAATGYDLTALIARPDLLLDEDELQRYESLIARRLAREPVSHILGRREFWGLTFEVTPDTLSPRPDTEALVEAVLDWARETPERMAPSICDLGTGAGAILLALLTELPEACGVGVDISARALDVAAANASRFGVQGRAEFVLARFDAPPPGPFDILVANPPYIRTADLSGLPPEVRDFDPVLALDGGPDGLDAYRAILAGAPAWLRPSGLLALEFGCGQSAAVVGICEDGGFSIREVRRDLAGIERVVTAIAP